MAVDVAVFMEEHGFTPEEAAVVTEETDHLEELILADDGDLEDIAESFLLLPRLRFLRVDHLAISPEFRTLQPWTAAQQELGRICTYKTPRDKLVCIACTARRGTSRKHTS